MNKSTTSIAISLALLSLTLLAVFGYGLHVVSSANGDISTLSNQADEATKEATLIQKVKSIKSDSKDSLARLDEVKLTDDELVPLFDTIESTGKSLGVTTNIESVSEDDPEDKDALAPHKIHISIQTQGSWPGSMAFIHAVETLPLRVSVDSLLLNKAEDSSWASSMSVTLYIFK